MATWTSWSGLSTAHPAQELSPHDAGEVVDAVVAARHQNLKVKMPGTGHSFCDIALTDGLLLRPASLRGIVGVDQDAMTVTALAGTTLAELNSALEKLGLTLHNMGDIDEQTVAGAISTGTHGTGGRRSSLSAQVSGLELVTGKGELMQVDAQQHPEVLDVARLGLGALGILTAVTFDVEPIFTLEAFEAPMLWDEGLDRFEELATENQHFEVYWFPHTERLLTKRNNRTLDDPEPLSRMKRWFDDEFLPNRAFGWANRVGNRLPGLVRRINDLSGRALSERRYSDVPHRVFTSRRTVVFREMEYALPRSVAVEALREVRSTIDSHDWTISFPVEIRVCPADEVPLSTAYQRDSVYLAFHMNAQTDHTAYFKGVEDVLRTYDGRPHWGKLHTRTAEDLAPAYPRFADFVALRDRLDPDRLFTNAYLERVLSR
jgi:FAD-linked oxidoreductase